ncbi:hypothetical protein KC331_g15957 [Hortaea werneckii]|uniref:N-acetyltransferase domain-containing protein n=1 Tax=Hortaea werneckii TaxID=91943 RepID=A0A3M7C252_HORWE|nr:hypothetical protein KC331_g15957 [Hortaea werneckii]RMY46095.1 hypothetical protein D0865_09501 [Hortaea werneckii]
MPRDLHAIAKEESLQGMPRLTKSPEEVEGTPEQPTSAQKPSVQPDHPTGAMDAVNDQGNFQTPGLSKRDDLHPYTQSLSIKDIDSCTKLEEETFPPNERATREKFEYRLKHCGELCVGVYTSHSENKIPTAETSAPVYSGAPQRKAVLIGHLIVTKTTHLTVTDADMAVPSSSSSSSSTTTTTTTATDPTSPSDSPSGPHKEEGRTILIHSLAVLPQYQNLGLGRTLMESFLQRTEALGVADRAALITHEKLIPYYEKFGFQNKGLSECKFAGGGWFDMIRELRVGNKGLGGPGGLGDDDE